ncbi:MAG: hypothetical protein M3301_06695, partial [Chloroflexota bacterium]|nr:hypothetical protein [Chloroflexota bacterium]
LGERISEQLPEVDLQRFADQLRGIDLERFGQQLRGIDLERFARQLRDFDLERLGRQLRERVQPKPQPDPAATTAALLAGIGIGAAAMYLLDPDQGGRRRALIRDQLMKARRVTTETVQRRSRDMGHRAEGTAAEMRPAGGDEGAAEVRVDPMAGPAGELP